jgi:hypothetical protein
MYKQWGLEEVCDSKKEAQREERNNAFNLEEKKAAKKVIHSFQNFLFGFRF